MCPAGGSHGPVKFASISRGQPKSLSPVTEAMTSAAVGIIASGGNRLSPSNNASGTGDDDTGRVSNTRRAEKTPPSGQSKEDAQPELQIQQKQLVLIAMT